MAIWLFRAGKSGEYENKFLKEKKIYLTWDELDIDLSKFQEQKDLFDYLVDFYSNSKRNTVRNWTGQIWPMAKKIKKGDWVILPSKFKPAINIGEVISDYMHHPKAENPFFHSRNVKWFATDIPRSNFDQDILYSLGAFMTVCKITRNDAEKRIIEMSKNKWKTNLKHLKIKPNDKEFLETEEEIDTTVDLELFAKDQIAKYLIQKFKGHNLTILIEAILQAKGYVTYRSPEGTDKGVDILAAPEPMGFGNPKICVQVKSGDSSIDRPTLDQLIGSMQNFNAEHGLLVSWSGFKSTVEKEVPNQFFKVRMWSQNEIIEELFKVYDKLDDDIKTDIPIKRIWTLSLDEES